MSFVDTFILALILGLAEFFPVSSSGHLALAKSFLNIHNPAIIGFDLFIHVGTIVSLLIIFGKDIYHIIRSLWHSIISLKLNQDYQNVIYTRLGVSIIIACIPAGIIGFGFYHVIGDIFADPKLVSVNIIITGLILFLTRTTRRRKIKNLGIPTACIIGLAQAIAIMPGISRSGIDISAGLFMSLSPTFAARFSFFLAIPVLVGEVILESRNLPWYISSIGVLQGIIGIIVSSLAGYIAIKLLLKIMERHKLNWFAFYCLIVGMVGILYA